MNMVMTVFEGTITPLIRRERIGMRWSLSLTSGTVSASVLWQTWTSILRIVESGLEDFSIGLYFRLRPRLPLMIDVGGTFIYMLMNKMSVAKVKVNINGFLSLGGVEAIPSAVGIM